MPVSEVKQALMRAFRDATYALSAHDPSLLPHDSLAEVAFVGRSNSGKSSAINALTSRRRLAHISRTPGRTQSINLYNLGNRRYLVDLPGYGYAAIPAAQRRQWDKLISAYINNRPPLRGFIIVMDARHAFSALDYQLLEWLPSGIACHILLSKADKLAASEKQPTYQQARVQASRVGPGCTVQLFSSKTGEGVAGARRVIAQWLENK